MEKDDEISGTTGSHLDFGAREYDSRIGRWWAVDPLAAKYTSLSPYSFCANSPIQYKDGDGRKIVDANGNEVEVTITKSENGNSISYKFADETTDEVKEQFYKNAGEIFSAMIQKPTSMEILEKVIADPDKARYTLSDDSQVAENEEQDDAMMLLMGWTEPPRNKLGFVKKDGIWEITLYKGSNQEEKKAFESGKKHGEEWTISDGTNVKLTNDNKRPFRSETKFKAVTGTHESVHFLNKNKLGEAPSKEADEKVQEEFEK